MSNVRGLWQVLALLAVWVAAPARADVVYSTLGPDDSWDQHSAYVVLGPDGVGSPRPYAPGMQFTPDFDSVLTYIELPIGASLAPGTNELVVELRADDGTGLPGDVIESYVFDDLPYVFSRDGQYLSVAYSALQPILSAGVTYWIDVFPGADDTSGGWNLSSPLLLGDFAATQDGGATWTLDPYSRHELAAFRVNGDPL